MIAVKSDNLSIQFFINKIMIKKERLKKVWENKKAR